MRKFINITKLLVEDSLPLNHQYRNYAFNIIEKGPEAALKELARIQDKIKRAIAACKNRESQFHNILSSYVPTVMSKDEYDEARMARALCDAQTAIVTAQRSPEGNGEAGKILHEGYQIGDRVRDKNGRIGTIKEVTGDRYKVAFDLEEAVPQKPLTPAEATARKAEMDSQKPAQTQKPSQKIPNQNQPAGMQNQPAGMQNQPAGNNQKQQAGNGQTQPAGTQMDDQAEDEAIIDAGDKAVNYLRTKGVISS